MKHVKVSLSIILISVLLVSLWIPMLNPTTSNTLIPDQTAEVVPAYVTHGDINIVGDADFHETADLESWVGDGLSSDTPYLIQGYEIVEVEELISITDTTVHFEILDCNLTISLAAIYLHNVTNGLIQNCLISEAYYGGILMENVTGIDVTDCNISMSTDEIGGYGVHLEYAIDCSVNNSIIKGVTDSGAGIYSILSEGITLFNNTIFEFDNHGIYFDGCFEMNVLNNTLYWNEGSGGGETCGMYIFDSFLIDIIGNNVTDNSVNGITLLGSNNVTILENTIAANEYYGVYVDHSDYCVIQDNLIEAHGNEGAGIGAGVIIDTSEHCEILENTFYGNLINSISLGFANFVYVYNNHINHSYTHGMGLYSSHNVTIEANEIYNSYGIAGPACGIYMDNSDNASLVNNILGHSSENGITIYNSDDGEMIGNTIYDSEYSGLRINLCSFWTVFDNVIYDNGAPGIYLDGGTDNITLYQNDIGWSGEFLAYDAGQDNAWNYTDIGNWYSDYDLEGTYDIIGGPSIDHHPSNSLYCGGTDPLEYEAGTTGNTMHWNSSALNGLEYDILIDDELFSTTDWDGSEIDANVDGLPVGEYNVTLVVYHVSGHWLYNASTLTVVDTQIPTWDIAPEDQYVEFGDSASYDINASDPSGLDEWWLTGDSGFAIDSNGVVTNTTPLHAREYELTVHVNDTQGHVAASDFSIIVEDTINPVWTTTPSNQVINEGESFSYQLSATDLAGIEFWNVNDTVNFAITQDGLITNATALAAGMYFLNISVADGHLNVISITISIQVNAGSTTTTTTTTTTDTTTDTTTPPPDDLEPMVVLVIGGVGAIVLIGGVLYVIKSRAG